MRYHCATPRVAPFCAMTKAKGKPSLVLLHGLGGSSADWAEAAKILSKSYDVLALDLPGAGAAPKPAVRVRPRLARALRRERDGGSGFPLVPTSPGTRSGRASPASSAAREPSRVVKLALVSPVGAVSYGFTDRLKWKGMSRRAILTSVPESSIRNASGYGFGVDGPGEEGLRRADGRLAEGPRGGRDRAGRRDERRRRPRGPAARRAAPRHEGAAPRRGGRPRPARAPGRLARSS